MITIEDLLARTVTTKDGCMEWLGSTRHGYGQLTTRGHPWGQEHRVHRLIKQLEAGRKFDPTELVLHKCDNKICINPEHLYVGTAKDNTRDIYERGNPYSPLGRKHSSETILKMRAAKSGENNPFFGRKHTEETKARMSRNNARRKP